VTQATTAKIPAAYRGDEPYAFACYAHEDSVLVYDELADLAAHGFRVYYDEGIGAGRDWHDDLADAIDRCSLFIVFVTRHSVVSRNCIRELNYAHDKKKDVLAVHLDDVELPRGIKLALGDRQAIFRGKGDSDRYRARLTQALEEFLGATSTPRQIELPASAPPRTSTHRRAFLFGGIASVLIAIGAWLYRDRLVVASSELPPIRSLAVLPLENLSGDPKQDYFADAMTEKLIAELSKLSKVRVVSRTSVMQYKGTHRPLREIANQLGVDGIVEGSVVRSGEQVRITAQLIDARNDRHLWAESYDRDVAHVLDTQSEVAHAVANAIQLALLPDQSAGPVAEKLVNDAHDAYELGLATRDGTDTSKSDAAFEQASLMAPDWAAPRASHAANYYMVMDYVGLPYTQLVPERTILALAKDFAQDAVKLDDALGDAHMALGIAHYLYDWDWETAERELRRGRELSTWDPVLLALAPGLFFVTGQSEEALAWMHDSTSMAPTNPFVRARRAELLRAMGRSKEALEEADRILAAGQDQGYGSLQRLYALESLNRWDDLDRDYRDVIRRDPKGTDWLLRIVEEGNRVLRSEGQAAFWRYSARTNLETAFDPVRAAKDYIRAGAYDEAFGALEQAYRMKVSTLVWVPQSAEFAALRGDPRFTSLAHRLNLPVPAN
jgi:TolB-like protein